MLRKPFPHFNINIIRQRITNESQRNNNGYSTTALIIYFYVYVNTYQKFTARVTNCFTSTYPCKLPRLQILLFD